ncbi:hypothetical protein PPH41_27735, partial [Burkholderia gladioli]|nr:hypothetical protein [Burkholderia gladioli]
MSRKMLIKPFRSIESAATTTHNWRRRKVLCAGASTLVLGLVAPRLAQAFFTLGFARVFLGERVRAWNLLGLAIAAGGLAAIAAQAGGAMTTAGFALTLCAAASWALGNIVTKRIGPVELVPLVVWG